MKTSVLLFFTMFSISFFAQKKTCNDLNQEILEDVNSITKCTIESNKLKNKKVGQISVKVSAPKKRFFYKKSCKTIC